MVDQKGYEYAMDRSYDSQNRYTWRCKRKNSNVKSYDKCIARAWTVGNKIIKFTKEHNHLPSIDTSEIELIPHIDLQPEQELTLITETQSEFIDPLEQK